MERTDEDNRSVHLTSSDDEAPPPSEPKSQPETQVNVEIRCQLTSATQFAIRNRTMQWCRVASAGAAHAP